MSSDAVHPLVRARWVILACFVALCGWLLPGVASLQHDEDVLAFLPPDHPDVVEFERVADRFGMLEVALVGLYADGEDLFVSERTEAVREMAVRVAELPGVRLVLSYPDLPDARVEGDTLVVEPLVPKSVDDAAEIRRRVLANVNAPGNFVSADGTAAMLLVYLLPAEDSSARNEHLQGIRDAVAQDWDGEAHFGGGPYAQSAAALSSRADIERLSPAVIGVLVVASALLLGSFSGAALNLIVTGLGVGLVIGAHGRFGEPLTIVSSTTPVMMVALGGAFGMHIIAGYQRQVGSSIARASATVRELMVPVILSGITTSTAFFALVVMPQAPMKRFGVVAGLGVLLLLGLSLLVLPALLSLLPERMLPTRSERTLPMRKMPPLWALGLMAVLGVAGAATLNADPDIRNVFDAESEPGRADAFLAEHFGGSQFVQVAIEGDLTEPAVLRAVRGVTEEVRALDGVHDVRSLLGPVALLTDGFGGRAGIPATPGRTRRVVSNLADQSPMAQLMTPDQEGAIVHIKLAPAASEDMQATTAAIRGVVQAARDRLVEGEVRVGLSSDPALASVRRDAVRVRVGTLIGRDISDEELAGLLEVSAETPGVRDELDTLRKRAFGSDEVIEPLPADEYEQLSLDAVAKERGKVLEASIRKAMPTLVETDPEGVGFAAEQLGQWVDEALERRRVTAACDTLKLDRGPALPKKEPAADPTGLGFEQDAAPPRPRGECGKLLTVLSELDDVEWTVPSGAESTVLRSFPMRFAVTGQPVIGQAFADSVSRSLVISTLVSIAALALTLLVSGHIRALLPAVWTLAVTAGVLAALGHPISIGTSMVSCIALGAGVDFAIHLGVRARQHTGKGSGQAAVDGLGVVVVITGVQLALAFCVLLASGMPPLREFGAGLAAGLLLAAFGAAWFTPRLYR